MPAPPRALARLNEEIVACRLCPRLVAYLAHVARVKKREFADWTYWGRPIHGFGDPAARLLVVGLAPAAHGGARTGRPFTGDSSGAFLSRAMNKAGFASIPRSERRDDGLTLRDAYITVAVKCAPPANKPLPVEEDNCRPYLVRELGLLGDVRVILALGKIAWDGAMRAAREAGWTVERAPFAHRAEGAFVRADGRRVALVGSYHPSRQNTNTGRLTEAMFDAVFASIRDRLATNP